MSTARTPPTQEQAAGGAAGGADAPPTNPRGQNLPGPFVNRGEDVRAALENAERLVAQTTTRLAAEEARATALDQQVQAMQAQGPSILAGLDSKKTNKVPDNPDRLPGCYSHIKTKQRASYNRQKLSLIHI